MCILFTYLFIYGIKNNWGEMGAPEFCEWEKWGGDLVRAEGRDFENTN
jgi:hypothetical protein